MALSSVTANQWRLSRNAGGDIVAVQLGKRYECENCGTQVLATKATDGTLNCCDKEMDLQGQRRVPSAD